MAMLSEASKEKLINKYRRLASEHSHGPGLADYKSIESQFMRLEQLTKIGDLANTQILEIGCGLGDFLTLLTYKFDNIKYTGVDIVPEIIERAKKQHPEAKFECRDILQSPIETTFDYVFISGVFNNYIPDGDQFLLSLTAAAYKLARVALGFNFISTYVNYREDDFYYYDPMTVLKHCLDNLSWKTVLSHHYKRADVSVFVYRPRASFQSEPDVSQA